MSKNIYKDMMEQVVPCQTLIQTTKNKMTKENPIIMRRTLVTVSVIIAATLLLSAAAFAAWHILVDDASESLTDHPPIEISDGKTYVDLGQENKMEVSFGELADFQLRTNSTRITVSIPRGNYEGEFLLYDAQHDSDFIQSFTLDQSNRTRTFSGLTSAKNYFIVASGIDEDVIITITY